MVIHLRYFYEYPGAGAGAEGFISPEGGHMVNRGVSLWWTQLTSKDPKSAKFMGAYLGNKSRNGCFSDRTCCNAACPRHPLWTGLVYDVVSF